MIEASQRMLKVNSQGGEGATGGGINAVIRERLELEIRMLQNASPDAYKLRRLLQVKERQKEEAIHIEETHKD